MGINSLDKYCIGNVLRIIDDRTIIINVGREKGIIGKKIQVYEVVDTIKDLEGCDIDVFIYVKDTLEMIQVENNYSICRKMEYRETTFKFALSPLLEQDNKEYIPLNIDKQDIAPLHPKDPLLSLIHI